MVEGEITVKESMPHPLHFNVMLMARDDTGPRFPRFTRQVKLAEQLGFHGIFTGNSYALGGPDPFALLGHAVSITEDMQVGTSVFLLPMRHPTTVAIQAATLDQMSRGRFLFAVGVGGERGPDFSLNGISAHERGARMDESLQVLNELWSGEEVHHNGRFYEIEGKLGIQPARQQLALLIGARGGATPQLQHAYQRVVQQSRGWLPYIMTPSGYARGREAITTLGGANDLIYGLVEMTNVGTGDGTAAIEEAAIREAQGYGGTPEQFRRLVLAGNAEQVIDRMNQFADLGCTEFVFNWACDPAEVENQIRILASEIIPAVKEHAAQQPRLT